MRSRLMSGDDVATYLGMARSTFDQKRPLLEAGGMPAPVLNRDEFGSLKWDRHAIDAWLDSRSGLNAGESVTVTIPVQSDWEDRLIGRAQSANGPQP